VFRRFFQTAAQGRYSPPSSGELWDLLLVIALNRLRAEENYHRAARRDVRQCVGLNELASGLLAGQREQFDQAELALVLRDALSLLPEHFRQALQFRLEGLEVAEIAGRMGCSKRTVERYLQEGYRLMRRSLGGEDDEPGGD
jgi:RNA polymerase sigma factor (sigma-70 family)